MARTLPAELPGAPGASEGSAHHVLDLRQRLAHLRPGLTGRMLEHVRTPLYRDGYALVVNSAVTAGTGLLFWVVAANAYSPHAVGLNSALISSMMFLAGLASLNLTNVLVRFLPEAGRRTAAIVARSYLVTALVAAVVAALFLVGVEMWAPRLVSVTSAGALEATFVLATMAWCVFVIQDSVLTALGRAVWVPVENAVFSVLKLVFLAACAALVPLWGIFVSWTVAMLVAVVGVNVVVFTRLVRRTRDVPPAPAAGSFRQIGLVRYAATDYVGALAWLAAVNLLPVVVTASAGATTNAHFALAWAVAFPLYAVPGALGTSLVLHATRDPASLPVLVRKTLLQGAAVLVPAVALMLVLAPFALSLFGATYAEHGTSLLRLLALGALPDLLITIVVSVARVERRLGVAVIALAAHAVMTLALVTPLLHAMGVLGAGVAWVGSLTVVAAALLAGAAAGLVRLPLPARAPTRTRSAAQEPLALRILAHVEPELRGAPRPARTDSDVAVFIAGERVVKIARSSAGAAAIAAQRATLDQLRNVRGLNGWTALVPEVVTHGTLDGRDYLVETALPGVDGRRFAASNRHDRALSATARGMAGLYDATAVERVVDDRLLAALVDDRLDMVAHAREGASMEPLAALRTELTLHMQGRRVLVGRVHGDLWLGNALLTEDGSALSGVVDWEASRARDMPAIDVAHLVLSSRAAAHGRELGAVVRRLLRREERLSPLEYELIEPYMDGGDGPLSTRTVVLLAWLQHVSQRLTQSELKSHGRWMRRNVDPVLDALMSRAGAPRP